MDPLALQAGFLGFDAETQERISGWARKRRSHDCSWLGGQHDSADIWCVNGAAIAGQESGVLTVRQHGDEGASSQLVLQGMRHLMAVAGDGPCGIAGAVPFDTSDARSVATAFQILEMRLIPLRSEYALGAAMVWHQEEILAGGVYHLLHRGRLLAVLDVNRQLIGFSCTSAPADLLGAEWHKRPRSAGTIPCAFTGQSMWDPLWTYASRTRDDILPARFRKRLIFFHSLPRIRIERLDPTHVKAMATLQSGPIPLGELAARLATNETIAARCVAALHAVGVVSTRPPERESAPTPGPASRAFLSRLRSAAAGAAFFRRPSETSRELVAVMDSNGAGSAPSL